MLDGKTERVAGFTKTAALEVVRDVLLAAQPTMRFVTVQHWLGRGCS